MSAQLRPHCWSDQQPLCCYTTQRPVALQRTAHLWDAALALQQREQLPLGPCLRGAASVCQWEELKVPAQTGCRAGREQESLTYNGTKQCLCHCKDLGVSIQTKLQGRQETALTHNTGDLAGVLWEQGSIYQHRRPGSASFRRAAGQGRAATSHRIHTGRRLPAKLPGSSCSDGLQSRQGAVNTHKSIQGTASAGMKTWKFLLRQSCRARGGQQSFSQALPSRDGQDRLGSPCSVLFL